MPAYAEHMLRKRAYLKVLEHALWYDLQVLGIGEEGSYTHVFVRSGLGQEWACHMIQNLLGKGHDGYPSSPS